MATKKGKSNANEVQNPIVYRALADLKPNPKNPRKGSPEEIKALADSIEQNPKFFEARPILLSDRTGELVIIGGERRSEAAKILNMEQVPTILIAGLSEAEEDEIMIRDNTHAGEWDRKKLDVWQRHVLKSWGVKMEDFKVKKEVVDEFQKKFDQIDNSNCEYPIVPMADEDAEVFIILSRSEIDSNWLREKLKMNRMRSYKENREFKVNVCSIEDVKKCL